MKPARVAGGLLLAVFAALVVYRASFVVSHWKALKPASPGDPAPAFTLPRVDAPGEISLAGLHGKVVLIDFWATWCGPCRSTMPVIEKLWRAHKDAGLTVVSVNTDVGDAAVARVRSYAERTGLTFPIVRERAGVSARYGVESIPHMVVVDRAGRIRDVHVGLLSVDRLEKQLDGTIRELLAEPGPK